MGRLADEMSRPERRAVDRVWSMMECDTLSIWKSSGSLDVSAQDYSKKGSKIVSVFQNVQKYRHEGWLTAFLNRKKVLHVEFVFLLFIEMLVCLKSVFH
jgi:hypothetical protein